MNHEGAGERRRPRLVSVVIPVANADRFLGEQLDALSRQTYSGPFEVIVANNGSSDVSIAVADQWQGRSEAPKVVDASLREGANHARNVGVRAARGDFLAFCDADDVVSHEWLEALVCAAASCDAVGGRLDDTSLNDPMMQLWRNPHPSDRLPVSLGFLAYAPAANLGIWADVLEALGGWNEKYARGGTDVELCWRLQLASYRLCFCADAVVAYRYRPTLRSFVRQHFRHGRGSAQLYRDFRDHGVPRCDLASVVRGWLWLVLRIPYLVVNRGRRGMWLRVLAFRVGRVWGSIRFRVLMP